MRPIASAATAVHIMDPCMFINHRLATPVAASPVPAEAVAAAPRGVYPVRLWLWAVALCIFGMVVVGGATRLTQSGLSITEWNPVIGVVPPLSDSSWQAEFDKYKAIPQYRELFPNMDLTSFKGIFYWEWGHRLLGRVIGVVFAVPLIGFWITGRLTPGLKPRLLGLLALGGLQGLIGWWMVKSGLSERVSVSHYRLAVHLLTASVTFAWAIWLAEGLRSLRPGPAPARLRRTATALMAGLFLQLGSGALVAGLHAGLVYNTWPLMGAHLVPPLAELLPLRPLWSNIFETLTTVQFDHRVLAYGLVGLGAVHAMDAWRAAPGTPVGRGAVLLVILLLAQAALGITALLLVVPLWAALLHQAFAMVVLGAAVVHRRRMSRARYSADAAARA